MTKFEDEIAKSGYIIFTNKGDSMMPMLRQDRDLMIIRAVKEPLKKNDVVLFKRENGSYVLHRIVKVCGLGLYKIVGDNRAFAEQVPEEWIIGILTEVVRDGRHISVNDAEYIKYIKKLPYVRFKLKIKYIFSAGKRKIKRILFGRKDK